jgi:hypothetical protein
MTRPVWLRRTTVPLDYQPVSRALLASAGGMPNPTQPDLKNPFHTSHLGRVSRTG